MAYLRSVDDDGTPSGGLGCGAGCGCDHCRQTPGGISGFEEYYVPEEEDEPSPPTPPRIQQGASRINGFGWYGEPAPRLRRQRAESRLRMPAFETITGFAPDIAVLTTAQTERVNHAADFIARSWDRASPITSVRITGYIDRNEWQHELGQHRAAAVRDALIHTLDSLRPRLAERLRWIIEDRGLSTEAKVEIYLWAGPTPPPVPPVVRIPSPAEAARRGGPAVLPRRKFTHRGYRFRPPPQAVDGLGQPVSPAPPTGPVFDIDCPDSPGCPPAAAAQCRALLRQAIIEAIRLAGNAAGRVETATKLEPAKRDAVAKRTGDLFRFFFGHDPTRLVPWAGKAPSGTSVAFRFRAVAKELGGGRRIIFRCLPGRADCADNDLTCCVMDDNAWVNQAIVPNVVHLCPQFWNHPAGLRGLPALQYRAAIIIRDAAPIVPGFPLARASGTTGRSLLRGVCSAACRLRRRSL